MDQKDLIAGLIKGQLDWKNYSPNRTAMGYDADFKNFVNYMGQQGMTAMGFRGYDADFRNYSGGSAPDPNSQSALREWLNGQVNSGAMTTSRLRMVYDPVAVSPQPVDIVLFDSAFSVNAAGGVFNSDGNLVFTNAGGDTVTISCMTNNGPNGRKVTLQQLYNLTETEPFVIGWIRLKVKTTAQFDYSMGMVKDGQFGGYSGNSITPDDYVDPDQYQFLRVDVPVNYPASKKQGFSWTVDEDQTGTGVNMTLFIPRTLDPGKQLDFQSPVRNLNNGVNDTFYVPSTPTGQLQSIASSDAVKNIMGSPISNDMGRQLIINMQKLATQGGPVGGPGGGGTFGLSGPVGGGGGGGTFGLSGPVGAPGGGGTFGLSGLMSRQL